MLSRKQFIDQIMVKLGEIADAKGMTKAVLIVEVGQMLMTLENGLKNDEENHRKTIEELQRQIDDLVQQLNNGEPIEKMHIDLMPTISVDDTVSVKEVDQNGNGSAV